MEDIHKSDYSNNTISNSRTQKTWYQGLVSKIGSAAIGLSALFGLSSTTPAYAQDAEPQRTALDRNIDSLATLETKIQKRQGGVNKKRANVPDAGNTLKKYTYTQEFLRPLLGQINAIDTQGTSQAHYGNRHAQDNVKKAEVIRLFETLAETYVLYEADKLQKYIDATPATVDNYALANALLNRAERVGREAAITAKDEHNDDRRAAELRQSIIVKYDQQDNLPRLFSLLKEDYDQFIGEYKSQIIAGKKPDVSTFDVNGVTLQSLLDDFKEIKDNALAYNALQGSQRRGMDSISNYLTGLVPDTPADTPDGTPDQPDTADDTPPGPTPQDTPAQPGDGDDNEDRPGADSHDDADDNEDTPVRPKTNRDIEGIPTWLSHSPVNGERRNRNDLHVEANSASYSGVTHGESGGGSVSVRNDAFDSGFPIDAAIRTQYEDRAARSNTRRATEVEGGVIFGDAAYVNAFASELKERRRESSLTTSTTPEGLTQTDDQFDALTSEHKSVAAEFGFSARPSTNSRFFVNGALFEESLRSKNNNRTQTDINGTFTPDPVTLPDGTVIQPPDVTVNETINATSEVSTREFDRGTMAELGFRLSGKDFAGLDEIVLQVSGMGSLSRLEQSARLATSVTDSGGTSASSMELYDDEFNEGRVALNLYGNVRVNDSFSLLGTGYAGYLETQDISDPFGSGDLFAAFNTGSSRILIGGGVDYFGERDDNHYRVGVGFFNPEDEEDARLRYDSFLRVLARDNLLNMQTWYLPDQIRDRELRSLRDLGATGVAYADFSVFQFGGKDSARYGLKGRIVLPLSAFLRREDLDSFIDGFDASAYFIGSFLDKKERNNFKFEKTYNATLGVSFTFNDFIRFSLEGGIETGALSSTLSDRVNRYAGANLELLFGTRRRKINLEALLGPQFREHREIWIVEG